MKCYIYTLRVLFELDTPLNIYDVGEILKAISNTLPSGIEVVREIEFDVEEIELRDKKEEEKED